MKIDRWAFMFGMMGLMLGWIVWAGGAVTGRYGIAGMGLVIVVLSGGILTWVNGTE